MAEPAGMPAARQSEEALTFPCVLPSYENNFARTIWLEPGRGHSCPLPSIWECKSSLRHAMTLWCVITVGVDLTVEIQRWMRMDNVVALLLCACIVGISCAVLSLCMILMKGQKIDMEEEKPAVILVQESPEPTRTWS